MHAPSTPITAAVGHRGHITNIAIYHAQRRTTAALSWMGPKLSGEGERETGQRCTRLQWISAPRDGPRMKRLRGSWERGLAGCPGMWQDMERDCSGQEKPPCNTYLMWSQYCFIIKMANHLASLSAWWWSGCFHMFVLSWPHRGMISSTLVYKNQKLPETRASWSCKRLVESWSLNRNIYMWCQSD